MLKQNPDLCGIVGFWDGMDSGTAAAIKEAGLTGKVFLATSGGGEQKGACDLVKSGAFDLDLSYDVPTQASNMAASIKWLLQNPGKTGAAKGSIYTTLIPITKANAAPKAPAGSSALRARPTMTLVIAPGRHARAGARRGCSSASDAERDTLTRWRYRYWPDHALGEILAKRWMETAIPVIVLLLVALALSRRSRTSCRRRASPTPAARPARSASSCSAWRW